MVATTVEYDFSPYVHCGVLAAAAAIGDLLDDAVRQRLAAGAPAADPFQGLHLDASSIERVLAQPPIAKESRGRGTHTKGSFTLPSEVEESPLGSAMRALHLNAFEAAVIVLCLLPEIDARYGPLIGFLHDDVTRKTPSVDLALTLFAGEGMDRLACLHAFGAKAKLCSWQLLQLSQDEPLIRQALQLDRAFLWFLLGDDASDPDLDGVMRVAEERGTVAVEVPSSVVMSLNGNQTPGSIILLHGEAERTCLEAAVAAGRAVQRGVLVLEGSRLAEAANGTEANLLLRCVREAILRGRLPCITGAASLLQHSASLLQYSRELLKTYALPLLLIAESESGAIGYAGAGILPWHIPPRTPGAQLVLWREVAAARHIAVDEETLLALAETTAELSGTAIEEVAATAQATATANGEAPTGHHLQRAARAAQRGQHASLEVLEPRFGWDDIILPPARMQLLRHLCSRMRYRSKVRGEWGVGGASLPGVTALFSGRPGTGKSMAAEIVAADLGLDLYKIDLSQIVSKYIGETEKHLAKIFSEAEHSGVVLVFDEADALFGKRSSVKDSHDRYANIEVSYLLQRMERYRGFTILTTNLQGNLDEAFTRRIGISIDFPLPDAADRLRIWRRALANAPCDAELPVRELADGLELAGGAIVNVVITAAYLAAEEQGTINHERLLRAVKWEMQKMGRLVDTPAFTALLSPAKRTPK